MYVSDSTIVKPGAQLQCRVFQGLEAIVFGFSFLRGD